jgi:hypothetical protein
MWMHVGGYHGRVVQEEADGAGSMISKWGYAAISVVEPIHSSWQDAI